MSISESIFSSSLKHAKVVPISKKDGPENIAHHRPISVANVNQGRSVTSILLCT